MIFWITNTIPPIHWVEDSNGKLLEYDGEIYTFIRGRKIITWCYLKRSGFWRWIARFLGLKE
jgi:hypothetical protein